MPDKPMLERILIVDDERTIVDAGTITLTRSGYQVRGTVAANEAINLALHEPFDLLLSDLVMPGLSGIEVLRTIKSLYPDIAAVMITGFGSMQSAIEALQAGADGFLLKPFSSSELRRAVEDALAKRRVLKESLRLKALMPLYESSKAFHTETSLERLNRVIVEQVAKSVHAQHVALLRSDGEARPSLSFRVESAFPPGEGPPVQSEAIDWVLQTQEPLTLGGGGSAGPAGAGTAQGSILYVPLQAGGSLMGILRVEKGEDSPDFSDAETEIVSIQASQAAIAIKNALLKSQLEEGYLQALGALANALDARDPSTFGHNDRVSKNAALIARALKLNDEETEAVRVGALLHDIGKIGVPNEILLKPKKLTLDEYALVKQHPVLGDTILAAVPALQAARPVVLNHHERYDGTGYPMELGAEDIPMAARVVAVADAFDAVTGGRPHQAGQSVVQALRELRRGAGSQFDPGVVDAFFEVLHQAQGEQDPSSPSS